jgi:DNA-binding NarL/FixJ family response regulator
VTQLEEQALARRRRHVAGRYEGAQHHSGQEDRNQNAPFLICGLHNFDHAPMSAMLIPPYTDCRSDDNGLTAKPADGTGGSSADRSARFKMGQLGDATQNIDQVSDLGSTDTKILIVDDHALLREGLQSLLSAQPGMHVVGTAEDVQSGLSKIAGSHPDVVLSDLAIPESSNVDAIRAIKEAHPDVKVIALTFHREDGYIHAALRAGADGYVLKDDSRDELVLAIGSVLNGKNYLSPSICDRVIAGYLSAVERKRLEPSWNILTRRERQVVKMIAQGMKTREIAEKLSLSPKTVEKHRTNMMNKLDLHSVSAVTVYAIQSGLIDQ